MATFIEALRANEERLPDIPHKDGQLIATNTGKLYIDFPKERIEINETIEANQVNNLDQAIQAMLDTNYYTAETVRQVIGFTADETPPGFDSNLSIIEQINAIYKEGDKDTPPSGILADFKVKTIKSDHDILKIETDDDGNTTIGFYDNVIITTGNSNIT